MSSDDQNPLRAWAVQVKKEIQPRVREVTAQVLFEALVERDTIPVRRYYFGQNVPKSAKERFDLDTRLQTLKYISESLVVN
jgi:pyrimidine operon attenuation protein/uracil phosphoribosyltransferase